MEEFFMTESAMVAVAQILSQIEGGETSEIPGEAVRRLCELAADPDPVVANSGLKMLFGGLIERLNDSFTPEAARYYPEIFSQVIDFCRHRPEGPDGLNGLNELNGLDSSDGVRLDRLLNRFNLVDVNALRRRYDRCARTLTPRQIAPRRLQSLRKVLFPSRVTIGADVAITSVLMDGIRQAVSGGNLRSPGVELVLLGSRKLEELYGGDPLIRVREIGYARGGSLSERLGSWCDLVGLVESELEGLATDEYLIIDPDSRLTQLGLLPLIGPKVEEECYYLFPSREYTAPGCSSLGELASAWIGKLTGKLTGELIGGQSSARPFLALPESQRRTGAEVVASLRRAGAENVITVSLGVGGNEEKRVSDHFEADLLRHLTEDAWVIVDQGFSASEQEQVERALGPLRAAGLNILKSGEKEAAGDPVSRQASRTGILTWQGGIGSLAGLIAASDRYIGYDSSGQHLAAALGIPAITIFATGNSPLFTARWTPWSRGESRVIPAQQNADPAPLIEKIGRMRWV
jgi:hypothetical protein